MSVFFGIIKKDGYSVEKTEIDTMFNSVKHCPHNKSNVFFKENVGLGILHLYNTPESVNLQPPYFIDNEKYYLIGKARLDNRDELCNILEISDEQKKTIPDINIIDKCYNKWNKDCVNKIFGDWSFAVWNKNEKKLFIARDHHGVTAIYYSQVGNTLYFSTNIAAFLSIQQVSKEFNQVQIAHFLVGMGGFAENTIYKNIVRLPPAHYAEFYNGNFITKEYWALENVNETRFRSDNDYVDKFNELYTNAVKSRLRDIKPIGSLMSSGLDSTSVTAIAANELKKQNKNITAYTSVPKYNNYVLPSNNLYGDESELSILFSKMYNNINHVLVDSSNKTPLQSIYESQVINNSPIRNTANLFWIHSIFELAKKSGIGTLLNGQGGNFTVSFPFPIYYKLYYNKNFSSFLRRNLPYPITKLVYIILKKNNLPLNTTYINQEFLDRINLKSLNKKNGFNSNLLNKYLKKIRLSHINTLMKKGVWSAQNLSDYYGINVCDPTLDIKLIEYCYSIPDNQFVRKNHDRYLIRRAMKNILPEQILKNNKRGLQSADILLRISEESPRLILLANQINNNSVCNQFINATNLVKIARNLIKNNLTDNVNYNGFLRTSNVGLFLLKNNE